MDQEILNMMEDRRKARNFSQARYKELDRRVKAACKRRKEEWLSERCQEVEQLERADSRLIAEKIREMTGMKRAEMSTIIRDLDGTMLTEKVEALRR